MLENAKVARPCPASWNEMTGDERVRFCALCTKHVYNLSGMRRLDAERLVRQTEGEICVRFYRRADGTILTSDCPVGVEALKRRVVSLAGAGLGLLVLVSSMLTGRRRSDLEAPVETASTPRVEKTIRTEQTVEKARTVEAEKTVEKPATEEPPKKVVPPAPVTPEPRTRTENAGAWETGMMELGPNPTAKPVPYEGMETR